MTYDSHITNNLRMQLQSSFGKRLKHIVLFGSRARGDADEDSDYDIAVLLEHCAKSDTTILTEIAFATLIEENVVLSLFAFAADSLERYPFEPLFMNLRREGIAL